MKYFSIVLFVVFLSVCFFSLSCKESIDDLNISPNSPLTVNENLKMNAALLGLGVISEGSSNRLGGLWSGSFVGADRQYVTYYNYQMTSNDWQADWQLAYASFRTCKEVEVAATASKNFITVGIAKITRAALTGWLTSLFGDVPYFEAGNVDILTPKFDDQVSVYNAIQALLDEAILDLKTGETTLTTDFYYGADAEKWEKFAYSLKARYYLHVKDYDNAYDNAKKGISSAAESFILPHGDANSQDASLFWQFIISQRDGYMNGNSFAFKIMSSGTDYKGDAKSPDSLGRRTFYFDSVTDRSTVNYLCTRDKGFFSVDNPYKILSHEENQLVLAESAMRKTTSDRAEAIKALNSARDEVEKDAIKFDPASVYQDYVDGDFATDDDLINMILKEKFLVTIGNLEQFNDARRLNYHMGFSPNNNNPSHPERFLYPTSEVNANPNVPEQTTADFFTKTTVNK